MVITILWLFIWFITWLLIDEWVYKGKSIGYDYTCWFVILFLFNSLWAANNKLDSQRQAYKELVFYIECKSEVMLINVKQQNLMLDKILEAF